MNKTVVDYLNVYVLLQNYINLLVRLFKMEYLFVICKNVSLQCIVTVLCEEENSVPISQIK